MDIPASQGASSSRESKRLLDPQLAGYDLLRRLVCNRPPFDEPEPEKSAIPDEFERDIEFGICTYQISLYLEAVEVKFGVPLCERIRTHLLSLSTFDASLVSRLKRFLDAISTADEKHAEGRYEQFFDDPTLTYYFTLGVILLIASCCPEQRQRPLVRPVIERLVTARARAESVFERELGSFHGIGDSLAPWRSAELENKHESAGFSGVSDSFQWSVEPGPFERQLRRQQNNILFPVTARSVSAEKVNDARMGDLKLMADFMSEYRPIVSDVLSRKATVVKQASDLEKAMIDLIPPCMVVGEYFSNELRFLETVSDTVDQELARTTNEPSLRDIYKRVVALARIQGRLLAVSTGIPSAGGEQDFQLRSILSERLDIVSDNAQLLGAMGSPADEVVDAERIVSEAVREGLDASLGRQKLDAFQAGFGEGRKLIGKSVPQAGLWARLKRVVRRPSDK